MIVNFLYKWYIIFERGVIVVNKMVKEFLDSKKELELKNEMEEKEKVLIDLGLYEKVYSPDDDYSVEYSWVEWDSEKSKNRYYKKVSVQVSDEEYEEIKKYSSNEVKKEKNAIVTILTVVAWIMYIGGFILGIALGSIVGEYSFMFVLIYWVAFFVGGTMYLGLQK